MGYHRKFIKGYTLITTPMEKLLKNDVVFEWSQECQGSFDTLKAKMAFVPILVFPDWNKDFHVHVDASFVVLSQQGKGTWITQSHMAIESCHLLNEITQHLNKKAW